MLTKVLSKFTELGGRDVIIVLGETLEYCRANYPCHEAMIEVDGGFVVCKTVEGKYLFEKLMEEENENN